MIVASWVASCNVSTTPDWTNVNTTLDLTASTVFLLTLSIISCGVVISGRAIIAAAIAVVGAAPTAAVVVVDKRQVCC
jgi:hypothetical protein